MKYKVFALIEELNPESKYLTDDPDISAKINEVTNQVMFEMARLKKIPKYVEMDVSEGDLVTLDDIEAACGYSIFQVANFGGVENVPKAAGTVYKIKASGVAEIDCYVYPERIEANTNDKSYEFELSADVLEIMPYGIAADLLKSDASAEYGKRYAERYSELKSMLDPRYNMPSITFSGGYKV